MEGRWGMPCSLLRTQRTGDLLQADSFPGLIEDVILLMLDGLVSMVPTESTCLAGAAERATPLSGPQGHGSGHHTRVLTQAPKNTAVGFCPRPLPFFVLRLPSLLNIFLGATAPQHHYVMADRCRNFASRHRVADASLARRSPGITDNNSGRPVAVAILAGPHPPAFHGSWLRLILILRRRRDSRSIRSLVVIHHLSNWKLIRSLD
ncbi:hypothetical protein BJX63DRAFT_122315 [Aspergillus granulosus]|uniref:Uncharacterized protein n=1 Tax=Aspergillus granulosus TaxID=176169 RepID=A0ABR4I6L2_9EURO